MYAGTAAVSRLPVGGCVGNRGLKKSCLPWRKMARARSCLPWSRAEVLAKLAKCKVLACPGGKVVCAFFSGLTH